MSREGPHSTETLYGATVAHDYNYEVFPPFRESSPTIEKRGTSPSVTRCSPRAGEHKRRGVRPPSQHSVCLHGWELKPNTVRRPSRIFSGGWAAGTAPCCVLEDWDGGVGPPVLGPSCSRANRRRVALRTRARTVPSGAQGQARRLGCVLFLAAAGPMPGMCLGALSWRRFSPESK